MFKGNVCTTAVATTCRQHYDLQWDSYVWEHSDTEFCLKLSFLDCYLIRNWLWLLHSGIARVWGFFNRLYMLFTIVKKAFNSEWPLCGNTGWIVVSLSYSQFLFQLKKKAHHSKFLFSAYHWGRRVKQIHWKWFEKATKIGGGLKRSENLKHWT